jgi:hypothetical protein
MAIQSSTLRPGLLVNLKTQIQGNVKYRTKTLEGEHITEEGAARAKWETERTVIDPDEHEKAKIARNKARGEVTRICADSAFGLLCPESKVAELEAAVASAREIAGTFNAGAKFTRISVYIMTGKIAPDDVEAVKAINSEVRELLERMERGVSNLDAEEIRKAANWAKGLGSMLSTVAAERVQVAIDAARKAARQISKAGETAASVIDQDAIKAITASRLAFLDLDDAQEVQAPEAEGRAVDLEPSEESTGAEIKRAYAAELEI